VFPFFSWMVSHLYVLLFWSLGCHWSQRPALVDDWSLGACAFRFVLPWFLQSVWPHRLICGQRCLLFVGAFEVAKDAALNAATLCEIWWHFQTSGSVSIWFILLCYDWWLVLAFSL
jgi:hypothetical protein